MEKKLNRTNEKIPAPLPRRIRDLRQEFDHIDRPVMTWKRRWSVKEPSPLSLPSNQIQFPLRLPRISSRPNLPKPPPKTESHAPFKAHNLGYTILPPIRKESKRDPRMRREKRAYVDRWDANTDVRESDTDEEDHGPTTGLFWDRDDG